MNSSPGRFKSGYDPVRSQTPVEKGMFHLCAACARAYGLREETWSAVDVASPLAQDATVTSDTERQDETRTHQQEGVTLTDSNGGATLTDSNAGATLTDSNAGATLTDSNGLTTDHTEPPQKQLKLDSDGDGAALSICAACLGILDDIFVRNLTQAAVEHLKEANYIGVETFCLSIHTPLSLLVRRTGVELYLRKHLTTAHVLSPLENYAKEILRNKLKTSLEKCLSPLQYNPDGLFQIVLKLDHESSSNECEFLTKVSPAAFRHGRGRKQQRAFETNTESIKRALKDVTLEDFEKHNILDSALTSICSYEIDFLHKPLYVAGRYNKYVRDLSQTPWVVDGKRKSESSVQELICEKLEEVIRSSDVKFSSSGREDVDVRMLGKGRPFLVEFINPRKVIFIDSEITELQGLINSRTGLVAVRDLKVVGKDSAILLKEGEVDKVKVYSALVWTSQEITPESLTFLAEMKGLKIEQKTPIRVLHRRTLATRVRTIHSLKGEFVDTHHFKLQLSTQAGTYVKEFVHSDFGRTCPSLCDLMKQEVDILTLDVEDVMLDWPPL